jgi:hypothetical protein
LPPFQPGCTRRYGYFPLDRVQYELLPLKNRAVYHFKFRNYEDLLFQPEQYGTKKELPPRILFQIIESTCPHVSRVARQDGHFPRNRVEYELLYLKNIAVYQFKFRNYVHFLFQPQQHGTN